MAFLQVNYTSPSLGKMAVMNVVMPEPGGEPGPYPVFYLLHGFSDDQSAWMRRTSIERYASEYPLIVVMPDGGRGFYTDAAEGFAYESALVKDVLGFVDATFPTRAERGGRAIGGLSMGGYGAMKLGLKYPDLFCSVNSHSGALGFATYKDPNEEFQRIFGPNPAGGENDAYALAERLERDRMPALLIDCGTEDFLLDDNRDFHVHLERLGLRHDYHEYPGSHDWAYWDQHVQAALRFHAHRLGIARR